MARLEWYFVSHRFPEHVPVQERPFEIQILNENGQALAVGYFGSDSERLEVNGSQIPPAVLEATKRYPMGFGDYVDAEGHRLDLWGNPIARDPLNDREALASCLLSGARRIITMPSPDVKRGVRQLRAIIAHYGETTAAAEAQSQLQQMKL